MSNQITTLSQLTKKKLVKQPPFAKLKVGDKILIEATITQKSASTEDGKNDLCLSLEKNISDPSIIAVEAKHIKIFAVIDKANIFEQARKWLSQKTGISDDEELDDLIDQFGGRDKLVDALRQSMLSDLAKNDSKLVLQTKN